MVVKCGACQRYISSTEGANATCVICTKVFHKECVGVGKKSLMPMPWVCPGCKVKLPRNNQDNTFVKGPSAVVAPTPSTITTTS